MIILEEGNLPHPWCPPCDMLVPWKALNIRKLTILQCEKGGEGGRRRMVAEEMRERAVRAFQAYRRPLETVLLFKYLGRILTESDEN